MKNYLLTLTIAAISFSASAQEGLYDSTKTKTCFNDYYESFVSRGAIPAADGDHDIVFSARKDTTCFCGEGKISTKDGLIVPSLMIKKKDGTYEAAKKVLHPKTTAGEEMTPNKYKIIGGMSSTFVTDDYYIINLFFIDCLKRKVVPNAVAPNPDDISGIQIELTTKEKEIIQKAYEGLAFDNGKATIKASSFSHLNLLASMMVEKPEYKLSIKGYTDNVGSQESNLILSQKRAEAVKEYLVKQGVDVSRLTAEGFGIENPIGDNKTPEGRAKNRRVDFIMTK